MGRIAVWGAEAQAATVRLRKDVFLDPRSTCNGRSSASVMRWPAVSHELVRRDKNRYTFDLGRGRPVPRSDRRKAVAYRKNYILSDEQT